MKSLLPILLLFFFTSCAMNNLTMSVLEPAPVTVPPHIKRIGIVDRSKPIESNKALDQVDKILTAEGLQLDKQGAAQAIAGIRTEVGENKRFTYVKILNNVDVRGPGLGIFPAPLGWGQVQQICKDNNVDALMVLSFYDTDSKVAYETRSTPVKGPGGIEVPLIEHHATITTNIKTGWRFYDPQNKQIIDEIALNDVVTSTGHGINPLVAVQAVQGRTEAVKQSSNQLGQTYAARVLPFSVRVSRQYYVKGTKNFEIAKRKAQTGNWDGAAVLWKHETENQKAKVAGRAYYNMAISSEINGELDQAIDWAQQSYEHFNNKKALRYVRVLRNRKARQQRLEQQGH